MYIARDVIPVARSFPLKDKRLSSIGPYAERVLCEYGEGGYVADLEWMMRHRVA